jgi:hypothetical protein
MIDADIQLPTFGFGRWRAKRMTVALLFIVIDFPL